MKPPRSQAWRGTLVRDDYSGYKALFAQGITEAGCLRYARRKLPEVWANHKSTLAEQALALALLPGCTTWSGKSPMPADQRLRIRQMRATPGADALQAWLRAQRKKVPPGSATARRATFSQGATALTHPAGPRALPPQLVAAQRGIGRPICA